MIYDFITKAISAGIGIFSPRAAIDYLKGHQVLRKYDAAKSTGPNALWAPSLTTGDQEIGADWRKTIDRARDLVRNNSFTANGVRTYAAFVVGSALWPQAKVRGPGGKGLDKPICDLIENRFEAWAEKCCVNGDSWDDAKRLVARHFKTDGEVIVHRVSTKRHPFLLEVLETDQLDTSVDGKLANGNYAVRGIEFDQYGAPVAYHLLEAHPGEYVYSTKTARVKAADVFHIFDRERATESRGICKFVSSVLPLYDHGKQKDAIMHLLRIAAAYGVFVETDYPEDYAVGLPSDEIDQGNGTTQQPYKYINPAGIHYMGRGQKINSAKPEQPTANYSEFERSHLRSSAAGFGMSYETFTGDLSNVNYSSLRHGRANEQALFRMDSGLFISKFALPAYRQWMDAEHLAGNLFFAGYWQRKEHFQRVTFNLPPFPWIDPAKEAAANEVEIKQGVKTRREICESQGKDFDDVIAELALEKEMMEAAGIYPSDPASVVDGANNDEQETQEKPVQK